MIPHVPPTLKTCFIENVQVYIVITFHPSLLVSSAQQATDTL